MSEVYSYAFADYLGQKVNKSYLDPYDAYQDLRGEELCLILSNKVVKVLDTKLISVKWAVACAQRVLKYFEEVNNNDTRPKRALIVAKHWIHLVESGASAKELKKTAKAANKAANSAIKATTTDLVYGEKAATDAAYAIAEAAYTVSDMGHAANAATDAAFAALNEKKEIIWQRKKLLEIVVNPFFELVKINYHENYRNLGLDRPLPFRDLGPKIMGYYED
jgi:hypothetical protein